MKGKWINILLVLIFLAGLSLLLYPIISDAYNSYLQSRIILDYAEQVNELESEIYEQELAEVQAYNESLAKRRNPYALTEEQEAQYWTLLDTTQIMAYVEIPSINVTLPIAHGTDEYTLQKFVGHLEWSSLPVGGESTHSVISGHRGLPTAELFTNIDRLEIGDVFYIHVLGNTLEYRVDQILVVLPHEYKDLVIEEGEDYVTMITCTPYGINSHRLLVRGSRTGTVTDGESVRLTLKNEVQNVDIMVLLPILLVALSAIVFIVMAMQGGKKKQNKKRRKENKHEET